MNAGKTRRGRSQINPWARRVLLLGSSLGMLAGASPAWAAPVVTLVDALGAATPATKFEGGGSGGGGISPTQMLGPGFVLTQTTVITEIGAFVNNCKSIVGGVAFCPDTQPFVVQMRPAVPTGEPDANTVIASFALTHDNDPFVISYERATPNLTLPPGRYYALFGSQGTDAGFLLNTATFPFTYLAGSIAEGFLNPLTGAVSVTSQYAAVRILGELVSMEVHIDIKPGSDPNSINPRSRGVIPVALLSTADFDATTAEPTAIRFGHAGTEASPANFTLTDIDGDGRTDMLLHFRTQRTGIQCGDQYAALSGKTLSGENLHGTDSIQTVGCP